MTPPKTGTLSEEARNHNFTGGVKKNCGRKMEKKTEIQ